MAKRKIIDWEAIEKEYRLGQKSLRTIATEFNINVSSISRRAKKEKWVQDKSKEIRERTKAGLVAQQEGNTPSREDIDRAVKTNIEVVLNHRRHIKDLRSLVDLLQAQLNGAAGSRKQLEDFIIKETEPTEQGGKPDLKRRNLMLKMIQLPAHSGVLRDLSMALKNLIPLERQAFSLDDDEDPADNQIIELSDEEKQLGMKLIAAITMKEVQKT